MTYTYFEIQKLFDGIDNKSISVEIDPRPVEDWWFGDPVFKTSNGWEIHVFDDCGSFDYVDHLKAPDGTEIGWYPECKDRAIGELIQYWHPSDYTIFGYDKNGNLPGY